MLKIIQTILDLDLSPEALKKKGAFETIFAVLNELRQCASDLNEAAKSYTGQSDVNADDLIEYYVHFADHLSDEDLEKAIQKCISLYEIWDGIPIENRRQYFAKNEYKFEDGELLYALTGFTSGFAAVQEQRKIANLRNDGAISETDTSSNNDDIMPQASVSASTSTLSLISESETEEKSDLKKQEQETRIKYAFDFAEKREQERQQLKINAIIAICEDEMKRFEEDIEKAWTGSNEESYRALVRNEEDRRLADHIQSAKYAAEDLGVEYLLGEKKLTHREIEAGNRPLSYATKTLADINPEFKKATRKYAMWQYMGNILRNKEYDNAKKLDEFGKQFKLFEEKLNAHRDSFGLRAIKRVSMVVLKPMSWLGSKWAKNKIHSMWHTKSEDATKTVKATMLGKRKREDDDIDSSPRQRNH